MKKLIFLSFLVTFSTFLLDAQKNVLHWENIPWGSTNNKIKQLSKYSLEMLDKPEKYSHGLYCTYIIKNYPFFNKTFSVHFIMDSLNQTLQWVKLELNDTSNEINPEKIKETYSSLTKLLINEYGNPHNLQNEKNSASSTWFFDSTIVSISYLQVYSFNSLSINYKKPTKGFDFRKTIWGYDQVQTKKAEIDKPIYEDSNLLCFYGTIANLKCKIVYIFIERKLVRAKYLIKEDHSNKNDFITDYLKLKDLLNKKYGNPVYTNDETWKNELFKDNVQDWGTAISIGHLYFYNSWETEKSNISILLDGENYNISLSIEYSSKKYENLDSEKEQNKLLDGL